MLPFCYRTGFRKWNARSSIFLFSGSKNTKAWENSLALWFCISFKMVLPLWRNPLQAGFALWTSLPFSLFPQHIYTSMPTYVWKTSVERKAVGFLLWGKQRFVFFFFLNAELLTSSLLERFHILLTSPFVDWFKPKRRPWPHLNDDSTNSGLCTRFLPLEKFPSGVINQIFAFPLSR